MPQERAEFVIVGAGLLGLASAHALHKRDREVVVLEQATVGHEQAGSKGASRIFRLGYTDPKYVRMAIAARPLWDELDPTLLTTTGQLTFGFGMDELARAMLDAGAPVELLSAAQVRDRFPGIALPGDALYEPDSAVIDAERTLAALRDGIDVREHTRVVGVSDGDRVTVHVDGGSIDANVAIVCPGPWSPQFVANTFATLEHVAYFRPLPDAPIFIEFAEPAAYGLPTPQLNAYKLALHHAGARVDANDVDFTPDPDQIAALQAVARRLFPTVDPEPVHVETCLYDNTPTEDFVLRRDGNIVIGAGTSGHGFKFGPLLGELLAHLAIGTEPRFDRSRYD